MKKRVCAYTRVSTNSDAQEHSFKFQSSYWNKALSSNPDYEYVGLYADKGISGKFADRRPQFMMMVNAVRAGKIDMIFTKSVQRFARNTQELLSFVREFREHCVAVYFEKERINTLTNGSDLILTIAAAVAEEDLSRYSQNVSWTVKKKFENGEPIVNGRCYGFDMSRGNGEKFNIIESEAVVVRKIFDLYLEKKSSLYISRLLNKENIPTANGKRWYEQSIINILRNEKYVGDLLLQKIYKVNGNKIYNKGEKDKYYVKDHHIGIVSREVWDKVQLELENRSNKQLIGRKQKSYVFKGLINCGGCGRRYIHKNSHSLYTPTFPVWYCPSLKNECHSVRIKDGELKSLFIEAYNEFIDRKCQGVKETEVNEKMMKLLKEQQELTRLNANGWIPYANYRKEYDELNNEINFLNEKLSKMTKRNLDDSDFKKIFEFDESKVEKFLVKIMVYGTELDFHFYNDVVITKTFKQTRIYDKDKQLLTKRNEGGN